MKVESLTFNIPYGLLELDATGIVRHFSPARENGSSVEASAIVGSNFFTEVAPFTQMCEIQVRFDAFMTDDKATTQKFATVFTSESGPINVQVTLARVIERSAKGYEELALMRIAPETSQDAVPLH
ncbi:MAG TPA: hypothetical protein VD966_10775 [Pyrinomonadaceae bacterium]|nr:hypothetical protein [Pyrinomonadaceae bacterium]